MTVLLGFDMSPSAPLTFGIIDYGMGNIQSVKNAFARLGAHVVICQSATDLETCDSLILPGVGAFGRAMENLAASGIVDPLLKALTIERKPLLGICLGMQLLVEDSEERGKFKGLGLIPGHVRKIPVSNDLRLPLIGWNTVNIHIREPLFHSVAEKEAFYFVHTYHVDTEAKYRSATCEYGGTVTAAIQKDHIFGVQFHPEKSQTNGLRLIKSFIDYSVARVQPQVFKEASC